MANSQVKCLEDDQQFVDITETSPEFYYSEKQRTAIETLISSGLQAFENFIKKERIRQFLSKEEITSIVNSVVDSELGKLELEDDAELDEDVSVSYWPARTDVPTPMLELGWPEEGTWKGITRAELYTHPPSNNAPHIKVVVRRTIQKATKVIAVVMDLFTDPDIFLDLHEAATRRKVPVYIILSQSHLSSFLHMVESTGVNVRFTENMRLRVVSGCTYSTRQLKQVTGTVKEKFLLVDGDTVITGTYSFTWRDSRLERNLITLLTGEITDSFDEQFRTLFASSRPLQRYDSAPNKEAIRRTQEPLPQLPAPKEVEMVNNAKPSVEIQEPYINGFSSPQRFNTSGALQPIDVLSAPVITPFVGVPLSKSVNKIAERRTIIPPVMKSIGAGAGFNQSSELRQDSSIKAKEPINVPDVSIRHRLAACQNFEGPTVNLRSGQESHSALSDILKNVQRSKPSIAKTTGGRPSKSLWDLTQLSQMSGYGGEMGQNSTELGDDAKHAKSRWLSTDTPAMLLMRHRAFPSDDPRSREHSNMASPGFKPSAVITPTRLQGQLPYGASNTWFSSPRSGRTLYYS
eukprot:XP_017951014.1 PREDICTED: protein FAM83E [Xenopus tropicalis]